MLLHSANQTPSQVPQPLLDAEAERQRLQRAHQEAIQVGGVGSVHTHPHPACLYAVGMAAWGRCNARFRMLQSTACMPATPTMQEHYVVASAPGSVYSYMAVHAYAMRRPPCEAVRHCAQTPLHAQLPCGLADAPPSQRNRRHGHGGRAANRVLVPGFIGTLAPALQM